MCVQCRAYAEPLTRELVMIMCICIAAPFSSIQKAAAKGCLKICDLPKAELK